MNEHKRRFRPRNQKNGFRGRGPSNRTKNNHFNSNGNSNFSRNGSMTNPYNVEKTVQKYLQLAKDAQSMGDPVLHENYLQHAEHYSRRLAELNFKAKENKILAANETSSMENKPEPAKDTITENLEKKTQ